jgi:hypothetical protein
VGAVEISGGVVIIYTSRSYVQVMDEYNIESKTRSIVTPIHDSMYTKGLHASRNCKRLTHPLDKVDVT